MLRRSFLSSLVVALVLAGCATMDKPQPSDRAGNERGREVAIFALSLIDTGYRFGGKNPEAGLDCSGMVAYIFARAADLRVAGSAADLAKMGRPVDKSALAPGDLVFFNATTGPLAYLSRISHVGIYIGDGRFVHAPSTAAGKVRIDTLGSVYFAPRFDSARAYFD